jgi:uncharacterized surface anchored protein
MASLWSAVLFGGLLVAAAAVPAWAQKTPKPPKAPATTGSIAGNLTGDHGVPLSGVKVTLTSEDTKTVTTATTDADGAYTFENLKPGEYDIQFDSKGYVTKAERVRVKAGKKDNASEHMKPPPVPKKPDTN